MRKTHHPPFQARVASVAIVTTVAVLGAACLTFMLQQWSVARQEARLSYQTLAKVTAASAAPALASGDRTAAVRTLAAAAGKTGFVDARLIDNSGRSLAEFPAGGGRVR